MALWKLARQISGNEEYTFSEGDKVTIGRGVNNTIILSSVVISRNHCEAEIQRNQILITDLKSSNGIYVGNTKIPQCLPYTVQNLDIIGFGWTSGARLTEIQEKEKFIFKLIKIEDTPKLSSRIKFQNEILLDVEQNISILHNSNLQSTSSKCKVDTSQPELKKGILEDNIVVIISDSDKEQESKYQVPLKKIKYESNIIPNYSMRKDNVVNILPGSYEQIESCYKTAECTTNIKLVDTSIKNQLRTQADDIVSILSDNDNELKIDHQTEAPLKKMKFEDSVEQKLPVKQININIEYEAFDVKQEFLAYDDEPIQIDSDSDTESERWILRLSQNSPGKPFTKISQDFRVSNVLQNDCSYSQLDDYAGYENNYSYENTEKAAEDLSIIDPYPLSKVVVIQNLVNDTINPCTKDSTLLKESHPKKVIDLISCKDQIDSFNTERLIDQLGNRNAELSSETKRTQMIDPLAQKRRSKSHVNAITESTRKTSISKHSRSHKGVHKKKSISHSEKESRKKKLKDIADKEKVNDINSCKNSTNTINKSISNVKITSSSRGAFLTNAVHIVKPTKRKTNSQEEQNSKLSEDTLSIRVNEHENFKKDIMLTAALAEKNNSKKYEKIINKSECKYNQLYNNDAKSFTKFGKPLTDTADLNYREKTILGKPFSKVVPLPPSKPKKKVRFSLEAPKVRVFQIEPGNHMKKTSLAKSFIENQLSRFSLEKLTLMKILRWNPHWLEEQINRSEPPPILGSNVSPKLHVFEDHNYYIQCFGDLLLIEIWECLTVAFMKTRNQNNMIQFRIESLPPVPPPEHCFDLFNISVNMCLPSADNRNVPRVGDVLLVTLDSETARNHRFFYVNNVRLLPSPPSNHNSFYSISLQATFTEKMQSLRAGELIVAKNLVYIKKELMLFEAMEYLNGSPLCNFILSPKPLYFPTIVKKPVLKNHLQWTIMLNSSQKIAVNATVSAALNDEPSINMVQGPPGTGKSSVICAIIMSYFYDERNKRQQDRGKILICATSNAAVDELVIRLLNIRQNLPKGERFRMVRVGRAEAMHPSALNVSSHQLALRDARSQQQSQAHRPLLSDEISHLEAKVNMWKTAAQEAKDPVRVAYCQTRITEINNKLALVQTNVERNVGPNGVVRPDQLLQSERRIIEGADIILTTLASAHNHKMKVLKERIALCIIDEAGQAIEPETLIPLTLGVKRLTLIGDPQQLPGYICSQRAKKYGLGESLFARLMSCMDTWTEDVPVIFLQQQYRMHGEIADYPNRAFYDSKIQTTAAPRPKINIPPYSVISISSGDKGQGSCGANEIEAWGVARLVYAVNELVNALKLSLAVITPYNAHKELIKKNLRLVDPNLASIEVNTVDSFQGQERDVVIVSLARSQGVGFLTDMGRMNVMLTRARHALLICLNPSAMLRNNQWRTLIEDAQKRNVYRVLPTSICQSVMNKPISNDILKYIQSN